MSDEPMKNAVPDDPSHGGAIVRGDPTVDTVELLADIGSQCRFMGAILKDIQNQLLRLERLITQEPSPYQHQYPNQSQEQQNLSGLKAQQEALQQFGKFNK